MQILWKAYVNLMFRNRRAAEWIAWTTYTVYAYAYA